MSAEDLAKRDKFQGAVQILQYNWRFYATTLVVCLGTSIILFLFPVTPLWKTTVGLGLVVAAYWIVSSLLVSHYIYDRSLLWRWEWIFGKFPVPPTHWVNVHAGLDGTSVALRSLFPSEQATILDIYNPQEMTEHSIARARGLTTSTFSAERADFRALPLEHATCDAAFVIFAAHEIRTLHSRALFFRELHRLLQPHGRLLLVEHLRDWPNFLAFGPGVFHFYPRREWLRVASESGFTLMCEFSITPFIRGFVFAPLADN